MNIGLLFGSFNPIHVGHLALASYLLEFVPFDEIWFVVSPQNPFKGEEELVTPHHRLQMVSRAIKPETRFRACDAELSLPVPSYSIDTLNHLTQHYPGHDFSLIIGSDNLTHMERWKASQEILTRFHLVVYPRPGHPIPDSSPVPRDRFTIAHAPLLDISSTWIRENLAGGKKLKFFLPPGIYDYIQSHHLYNL